MKRLIGILILSFAALAKAAEPAGRWEGLIQIPGRDTQVIFDLAQETDGAWVGSIILPGLNIKGVPLADIAVKESEVSFSIKGALGGPQVGAAKFTGRLNPKGALAGDFVQAGNSAPFLVQKSGPPQVDYPPKSTTIAKELEGEWKGEYELFGYPRQVTLKLSNQSAGGPATAEFVIVGKKTNNLPVALVTQHDDFLRIESHETGINYEGRFGRENGEIKGAVEQGPLEIPLVLRRATQKP